LPPFPSNLPTAPIAEISSQALFTHDPTAISALLEACTTHGFFYLDLRDSPSGRSLLTQSLSLLSLAQTAFALPLDEKLPHKLTPGGSLFGYKPVGTVKATDKDKRPDTTEFFNVSKDHMHGFAEPRSYPPIILESAPLFRTFQKEAHEVGLAVQAGLARAQGLPEDTFQSQNIFTKRSGDHVRLTHTAPTIAADAVGLPSHTDFGSVTILFNWLGGLQIQSRAEGRVGEWDYVKPLPGRAVINLGDAMVSFTAGKLKSAKHRVVPAPGEQGKCERYSVVYFVRPHDEAIMAPVEGFKGEVNVAGKFDGELERGRVYTAGEWMLMRGRQL
ncbi:Clavaminate synthase-like protein, partial [Trichodelitschia bisporula]